MMTRSTCFIAALLATAFHLSSACGDELLAAGNLQSLIVSEEAGGRAASVEKPLTRNRLGPFLTAAGFEAKQLGNDVYQIEVQAGEWTFPALVELSRDELNLWVTMSLKTVPEDVRVPADKVLGMLAANQKYAPCSFEYHASRKRFHLTRMQPNLKLTSEKFAAIVELQAKVALETELLWNAEKWPSAAVAK